MRSIPVSTSNLLTSVFHWQAPSLVEPPKTASFMDQNAQTSAVLHGSTSCLYFSVLFHRCNVMLNDLERVIERFIEGVCPGGALHVVVLFWVLRRPSGVPSLLGSSDFNAVTLYEVDFYISVLKLWQLFPKMIWAPPIQAFKSPAQRNVETMSSSFVLLGFSWYQGWCGDRQDEVVFKSLLETFFPHQLVPQWVLLLISPRVLYKFEPCPLVPDPWLSISFQPPQLWECRHGWVWPELYRQRELWRNPEEMIPEPGEMTPSSLQACILALSCEGTGSLRILWRRAQEFQGHWENLWNRTSSSPSACSPTAYLWILYFTKSQTN